MKIAIMIPCYNEELTIGKVIKDFKKELPNAEIFVYDNNSKDKTAEIAALNGACVRKEYRQGKGSVVRSMFRDIEADVYVMVDGDDTYPAEFVHHLIMPVINEGFDMVTGDRHSNGTYKRENKRPLHNNGNKLVRFMINKLFGASLQDIMTGYRAFSKKFVKNMPVLSKGFEIETEITLHSLDKKFLIKEVPINYRDRPNGSISKLSTFRDGIKVIRTIIWVFKDYKPLTFFIGVSSIFFLLGLFAGIPVIREFILTSFITKIPSAILAVGFMVLATISLTCGLILNTIVKQHNESFEIILNQYHRSIS